MKAISDKMHIVLEQIAVSIGENKKKNFSKTRVYQDEAHLSGT